MSSSPAASHRQILQALSGLLLALFVSTLASTVVSTALPRMLSDLRGSATQYTWVVTATLLAATIVTPIFGKLADLFSKRLLVQIAVLIFIAGSVTAGLAQSPGQLIAARALQGVGVGAVQTLVSVAIGALVSPRERGRYASYLAGVTSISTIGGPLLGGLIVDTSWLGWRWCFFVGVPVGVMALVLLQLTLRLPVYRRDSAKIDYWGALLITAGVGLLLIWLSFVGETFPWQSWQSAAMVGGSALSLGTALWVESRAAEPIVPLRILRQRAIALAILGSLAAGTAMYGAVVFLTQYFQVSRGYTATEAGLLTIPMMAGILVASVAGGRLVTRTGKLQPALIGGSVSLAAGFAVLGVLDGRTPLPVVGVAMALVGIGVGLTVQNFVLVVQNAVSLTDIGAASATVVFFRSLGGTVGVAVLGAVLARQVAAGTDAGVPVTTAYGDAIGYVFMLCTAVAVVGVVAALRLGPATLHARGSVDAASAKDALEGRA